MSIGAGKSRTPGWAGAAFGVAGQPGIGAGEGQDRVPTGGQAHLIERRGQHAIGGHRGTRMAAQRVGGGRTRIVMVDAEHPGTGLCQAARKKRAAEPFEGTLDLVVGPPVRDGGQSTGGFGADGDGDMRFSPVWRGGSRA